MDLNSLAPLGDNGPQAFLRTLGGDVLDTQHPTGKEYAAYLDHFASSPLPERGVDAKCLKDYISFQTVRFSDNPRQRRIKSLYPTLPNTNNNVWSYFRSDRIALATESYFHKAT